MKKIFLGLLFIMSAFASFGQVGSQALSGVFYRVTDTLTYQSQAATRHAQDYHDIYWNEQATTPHWDVWNGSSYDHIFGFGADVPVVATNTELNTGTDNAKFVSSSTFTTSKHPLESVSVTTTGGTVTIDFDLGSADDAIQKIFIGSNTWATSKTLSFSNATNALVFNFHFEVTNVAGEIVCSTCIAAASAVSGTWDSGSDTWTPAEIGKYEMGGTWDGSAWKIKIIGPFE